MGIFTPAASDPDLALMAVAVVLAGLVLAYVVVPFALYVTGRS